MRDKIPDLVRARHGRFGDHHAVLLCALMDHVDHPDGAIGPLDEQIDAVIGLSLSTSSG